MANFITNSTEDKSVKLSEIVSMEIRPSQKADPPSSPTTYELVIRLNTQFGNVIFEVGDTLEDVQALAIPILEALEAE